MSVHQDRQSDHNKLPRSHSRGVFSRGVTANDQAPCHDGLPNTLPHDTCTSPARSHLAWNQCTYDDDPEFLPRLACHRARHDGRDARALRQPTCSGRVGSTRNTCHAKQETHLQRNNTPQCNDCCHAIKRENNTCTHRPSEVFPTPGGPTSSRIGPCVMGFKLRTAKYSTMRVFTFSRPAWSASSWACTRGREPHSHARQNSHPTRHYYRPCYVHVLQSGTQHGPRWCSRASHTSIPGT